MSIMQQYNDYYVVGLSNTYSKVFIATGNIGRIMPYSYHGNTIFKIMLSPQQYYCLYVALYSLVSCAQHGFAQIINTPAKHAR